MQIILAFECDFSSLLVEFLECMVEPEWMALPQEQRQQCVYTDLERRLQADNKSLASYGVPVPPMPLADEPAVDARFLPDNVKLNPSQQELFDIIAAHLREDPGKPLFLHVEGEPGSGKSFVINVCLNHARAIPVRALAAAFPAKVATRFAGGQTIHYWTGLRPSRWGEDIEVGVDVPAPNGAHNERQRRGQRLRDAMLFTADEITMMRSDELDAIVAALDKVNFRGVFVITGNCAQLGAVMPGTVHYLQAKRIQITLLHPRVAIIIVSAF